MLLRWEPADVDRVRRDMNRMWTWLRDEWDTDRPRTRLHETDQSFVVEIEIPGVDPDTVELEVDGDSLMVKGPWGASPYANAPQTESFETSIHFPSDVDPERAEASYRHGMLSVSIPKAKTERRRLSVRPTAPS